MDNNGCKLVNVNVYIESSMPLQLPDVAGFLMRGSQILFRYDDNKEPKSLHSPLSEGFVGATIRNTVS